LRSVFATPAMRLPVAEETIFEVHAGDGGAHHRGPTGPIRKSRRDVYFNPQGRRHEEGRYNHLRGGLDPAFFGNTDDEAGRDAAVDSRQGRASRWRSQCVARAFEYPGRDRHGWSL